MWGLNIVLGVVVENLLLGILGGGRLLFQSGIMSMFRLHNAKCNRFP